MVSHTGKHGPGSTGAATRSIWTCSRISGLSASSWARSRSPAPDGAAGGTAHRPRVDGRACAALRRTSIDAKNRWGLGLQWGACSWLLYVVWRAFVDFRLSLWSDVANHWPSSWWIAGFWLLFPGWLAVIAALAAGSRWARAGVALMILGRVGVAYAQTHALQTTDTGAQLFVPLFVPLLPLVVLRVEEPRVVLALLALGRWREALARSGGVVALLVALAVLSTREASDQAMWFTSLPSAFSPTALIAALAGVATWATRKRTQAMA